MRFKFNKYQGSGNDFIVFDTLSAIETETCRALTPVLCERHAGIGADGVLLLGGTTPSDLTMRVINADGSEPEMCGNGLRCALRHWARQGVIEIGQAFSVLTGAGPRIGQVDVSGAIHLWMGVPGFQRSQIPATGPGREEFRTQKLAIDTQEITVSALSMGNPHLVAFVDDIASIPLSAWGPALESSPYFPERINVEFAQVQSSSEVSMRVWERGSGLTRACGTGACAVAVTGIREGSLQSPVTVHMPGGSVQVEWSEGSEVRLSGPAVHVFAGEFDIADFHPPS